jgi:hypothetical protein
VQHPTGEGNLGRWQVARVGEHVGHQGARLDAGCLGSLPCLAHGFGRDVVGALLGQPHRRGAPSAADLDTRGPSGACSRTRSTTLGATPSSSHGVSPARKRALRGR